VCYGNWCIEIRKYWCILSLDFNQGAWVLMPELAVAVKHSSVCCWGTANRLSICFSSKHCSFVYNTYKKQPYLDLLLPPQSHCWDGNVKKNIYIHMIGKEENSQWECSELKRLLGDQIWWGPSFTAVGCIFPTWLSLCTATIWGPDLNLIRKNNGYLQSNSWTIFWEIRACSSSTAHQWCSHIIPLLQVSSTHLTFI